MITNDGKDIISRYLLGQVPSYATHIAVGCGATPLDANDDAPPTSELATKNKLNFEMLRIPITSKGFINQPYTYPILSYSIENNIATLTTSKNHNISIGDLIVISDVSSIINGSHTVYNVAKSDTFSIEVISSSSSALVSGTVVVSKTKVSLTAEMPATSRYEITEVGLWSAPNNTLATGSDSYLVFNFAESWQAHDTSIYSPPTKVNIGNSTVDIIDNGDKVFYAFTNDPIFQINDRKALKEGPRFLNKTLMVRGDSANIYGPTSLISTAIANGNLITYSASNTFVVGDKVTIYGCSNNAFNIVDGIIANASSTSFGISSTITGSSTGGNAWVAGSWKEQPFTDGRVSTHIHLNGITLNISKNSPSDILTLAFSLMDRDGIGATGNPDYVKILVEFFKNEITTTSAFAKAEIYMPGSEFDTDRYKAYSFPISDLLTSTDFTAADIRIARVFTSIIKNGVPSDDFYICYDGFRLDNISTINPIFKLSGYSVVRTSDGYPIIKYENTNNYIDFRFNLGIV